MRLAGPLQCRAPWCWGQTGLQNWADGVGDTGVRMLAVQAAFLEYKPIHNEAVDRDGEMKALPAARI